LVGHVAMSTANVSSQRICGVCGNEDRTDKPSFDCEWCEMPVHHDEKVFVTVSSVRMDLCIGCDSKPASERYVPV